MCTRALEIPCAAKQDLLRGTQYRTLTDWSSAVGFIGLTVELWDVAWRQATERATGVLHASRLSLSVSSSCRTSCVLCPRCPTRTAGLKRTTNTRGRNLAGWSTSGSLKQLIARLHVGYWTVQAGLLTPLTFARHRLSPLAAFTSGAYFLHNGRR